MQIIHTASQKLSLSKNLIFSLKILTLNAYDLFRLVEEESLSNPALVFLNRKILISNFFPQECVSQDMHNNYDTVLNTLDEQIRGSSFELHKKNFLLDVLHNFLDEKLFIQKKEFLKKYSSKKYCDWLFYFKHATPPGIAACNLQERFKHQLEFYGLKESLSYQIIDECWKYFLSKKYIKIQSLLKKTEAQIEQAVQEIKKICKSNIIEYELYQNHQHQNQQYENPQYKNEQIFIHPDIILKEDDTLEINEKCVPKIKIDEKFLLLFQSVNDKKTIGFMKSKIKQVKNIILAIRKRNQTILSITKIAIDFQKQCVAPDFKSKRMTLKDISLKTNLSQSTVSRTLKNKSILTRNGIKMIGDFLQCKSKN